MMTTDTFDFEATARRIVDLTDIRLVREQLLMIWNARGAADISTVEEALSLLMGTTCGPYVKHLDRALRELDR
jgi:hypothetical protein